MRDSPAFNAVRLAAGRGCSRSHSSGSITWQKCTLSAGEGKALAAAGESMRASNPQEAG